MYNVLVFADVNLGAIDGSSSWVLSIAKVLSLAGAKVTVLAKEAPKSNILLSELFAISNVSVDIPKYDHLSDTDSILLRIKNLDYKNHYDVVFIRGLTIASIIAKDQYFAGRVWCYTVGFPDIANIQEQDILSWRALTSKSNLLFAQTPWLASAISSVVPTASTKIEVLGPMVPDIFFESYGSLPLSHESLILGYAGKFDKPWHTLEIPDLVAGLRSYGVPATLLMAGNKVQASKEDRNWHLRMQSVISNPPDGVDFVGAMPRTSISQFMQQCDVGIGWRERTLDTSYEISTKLLEFSASGTPVVINRTAIHNSIFGSDYPLFCDDNSKSVIEVLTSYWFTALDSKIALRNHVRECVEKYSFKKTAILFKKLLEKQVSRIRLSTRFKVFAAISSESWDAFEAIDLEATGQLGVTPTIVYHNNKSLQRVEDQFKKTGARYLLVNLSALGLKLAKLLKQKMPKITVLCLNLDEADNFSECDDQNFDYVDYLIVSKKSFRQPRADIKAVYFDVINKLPVTVVKRESRLMTLDSGQSRAYMIAEGDVGALIELQNIMSYSISQVNHTMPLINGIVVIGSGDTANRDKNSLFIEDLNAIIIGSQCEMTLGIIRVAPYEVSWVHGFDKIYSLGVLKQDDSVDSMLHAAGFKYENSVGTWTSETTDKVNRDDISEIENVSHARSISETVTLLLNTLE